MDYEPITSSTTGLTTTYDNFVVGGYTINTGLANSGTGTHPIMLYYSSEYGVRWAKEYTVSNYLKIYDNKVFRISSTQSYIAAVFIPSAATFGLGIIDSNDGKLKYLLMSDTAGSSETFKYSLTTDSTGSNIYVAFTYSS